MSGAYYNEHDPKAAAWLRELINDGLIADGEVDERSITDVRPDDLLGFAQCHFFAGIGGWSYALRLAGWPDDRPVWTGSCPCQPFSAAGKGEGFNDPRHLWPEFFRLIRECRPQPVFGEQVSGALGWLDLVSGDLESEGYACGAVVLGAHSVGAPHLRQRLYWVADAGHRAGRVAGIVPGAAGADAGAAPGEGRHGEPWTATHRGADGGLADTQHAERRAERAQYADAHGRAGLGWSRDAGGLANPERERGCGGAAGFTDASDAGLSGEVGGPLRPGFWADADWLPCRDGVYRPVEPGTFPLAHGLPARVGRLRGYGNAIVPQVAAAFIDAWLTS